LSILSQGETTNPGTIYQWKWSRALDKLQCEKLSNEHRKMSEASIGACGVEVIDCNTKRIDKTQRKGYMDIGYSIWPYMSWTLLTYLKSFVEEKKSDAHNMKRKREALKKLAPKISSRIDKMKAREYVHGRLLCANLLVNRKKEVLQC
jgi:hypothetical protein